METKTKSGQFQRCLGLLITLTLVIGLAGCQKAEKVQLNNDLITFTDKFFDVAHATGNVFVIVGYNGRILRTEDAGKTWREILPHPVEFSLNQVTFVGNYGWAVGHAGTILHTRDGGKTWSKQQIDTDKTLFAISFIDQTHGWVSGDESTVGWTDNGGETWHIERVEVSDIGLSEETRAAVPDVIYYGINFVDAQNGWMVGEYGNIRHTSDGGKTWDAQHESLLDEMVAKGGHKDIMLLGAFFRVRFTDRNHGMAVGAGGAIAATDDGGKKWHWISREGEKKDVPAIHLYSFAQNGQDGQVVAVGANGTVLASKNGGVDWQPAKVLFGVFTWVNGIAFGDEGKGVLVGGRGVLLLTTDGGQTWHPISG